MASNHPDYEASTLGNASKARWKTRDGLSMLISDMTESHLRNSIRMLERNLAAYPVEQHYTGDSEYAEQAVEFENESNRIQLAKVTRKLRQLQAELDYREALSNKDGSGSSTASMPNLEEKKE